MHFLFYFLSYVNPIASDSLCDELVSDAYNSAALLNFSFYFALYILSKSCQIRVSAHPYLTEWIDSKLRLSPSEPALMWQRFSLFIVRAIRSMTRWTILWRSVFRWAILGWSIVWWSIFWTSIPFIAIGRSTMIIIIAI